MGAVPSADEAGVPKNSSPTITHYRVRVPTERYIRMREAKEGLVLTRAVYHDNGQLLFPEGTTLDASTLRRLRNFNQRSLYVEDDDVKWVDETTYQDLSDEAEFLDEKEVPAPEPDESTAADPEDDKFRRLYEFFRESGSTRRLQSLVGELEEVANGRNQRIVETELESIDAQIEDVEEIFKSLLARLNEVSDPGIRGEIIEHLLGTDETELDLERIDAVPEDVVLELERWVDEKSDLRLRLLDLLHENPGVLEDLAPEAVPESGSGKPDPRAGPGTDEDDDGGDREAVEDFDEPSIDESELEEVLQENDSTEVLTSVFLFLLRDSGMDIEATQLLGDIPEDENALVKLMRDRVDVETGEIDGGSLDTVFRMLGSSLSQFVNESSDSKRTETGDEPSLDFVDDLLEEGDFQPEGAVDSGTELNQSTPEDASRPDPLSEFNRYLDHVEFDRDNSTDREQLVLDFLDQLRTILPRLLESLDESKQKRVRESFRNVVDELFLRQLTDAGEESFPEIDESESRRNDVLEEAVRDQDLSTIKKINGLPNTVIDQVDDLYRRPDQMNKWQTKLIDLFQSILHDLVYGLTVPSEKITRYLHQGGEVLEKEHRPFTLLLEPPDPGHYHLAHAYNSSLLVLLIGDEMECSDSSLESMLLASMLAEVGMTLIPDSFYLKQETLSPRAKSEIRKHPIYSRKIAGHILGKDHEAVRLVGDHHERLDGSGYPDGKRESDLSELAGVFNVADAYAAMIEDRVYRSARMPDDALSILKEETEAFPEEPVRVIEKTVGYYPNGSIVKLSDRRVAFVRQQVRNQPRKPDIVILTDENRNRLEKTRRCSLSDDEDISVVNLLRVKSTKQD